MPSAVRSKSSASVQVFWLDRQKVMRQLRQAAKDLAADHPEIERVILFGSMARGEALPGSDADLIIVADSVLPFWERSAAYDLGDVGVGLDVLVYTRAELNTMLADGSLFIRSALQEGVALFDRLQPSIQS